MTSANEKQVGGAHYKMPSGAVEHWDMVVQHNLNYFESMITKYVMRARKKNGKQDLEKALHFLEKYLEVYDRLTAPIVGTAIEIPDWFQIDGSYMNGGMDYRCLKCNEKFITKSGEVPKHACKPGE